MNQHVLTPPPPSSLRQKWCLAPGTIFLNHGSFGACPRAILKLQSQLRRKMEAEPVQFLWRNYEERLQPARIALAGFLGARTQDLVFVTNATAGVNAVVRSLKLGPGDDLLTTNLAYNACNNVLVEAVQRTGARLLIADVPFPLQNESQVIDSVLRVATSRTRLAMLDHVTSNSALVLPVESLVRELEARGIPTLVDGAHAPGMVPLELAKLSPAYYTGNLHKWVSAPKGAAFLWVREDMQAGLQPAIISHGNNTPRRGYSEYQDRFDWAGTFDPTAWMCVGDAIRWMGTLLPGGWDELRARNRKLALEARERLCNLLNVEMPCPANMIGSLATIPLPPRFQGRRKSGKIESEQLSLYDQFRIEVPFVRIGVPERRYFRISAQIYNTLAEYEFLGRILATTT